MLCCGVLCCVVLCCVVLCCVVLCCVVLCVVLCCASLGCVVLWCGVVWCGVVCSLVGLSISVVNEWQFTFVWWSEYASEDVQQRQNKPVVVHDATPPPVSSSSSAAVENLVGSSTLLSDPKVKEQEHLERGFLHLVACLRLVVCLVLSRLCLRFLLLLLVPCSLALCCRSVLT